MITSELLRELTTAFAETEAVADPKDANDRRRLLVAGMAVCCRLLVALWMDDRIRGSSRIAIEMALDSIERAARSIDREIQDGVRTFS